MCKHFYVVVCYFMRHTAVETVTGNIRDQIQFGDGCDYTVTNLNAGKPLISAVIVQKLPWISPHKGCILTRLCAVGITRASFWWCWFSEVLISDWSGMTEASRQADAQCVHFLLCQRVMRSCGPCDFLEPYTCGACGIQFQFYNNLLEHMQSHAGESTTTNAC